jgi:hypothetical protein
MATLSSIITPTNITTATNTQTLTNKTLTGAVMNGTLGATTPSTVAATTLSASGASTFPNSAPSAIGGLGFRNRIINGDMRIDQRNEGASVTALNSAVKYIVDRFSCITQSQASSTMQRVVDAPAGFINSLKYTNGTGGTPAVGEFNQLVQPIEGNNISDASFGTANAKTITVSFWVKSSLTGTFGFVIDNSPGTPRNYIAQYTINAANTWEYKTAVIPGDTTVTWATGNTAGMRVVWDLGSGTNTEGTANVWSANNYRRVSGNVRVTATTSATWQVTGVQLEIGNAATEFERRPFGAEFSLCERYFEKNTPNKPGTANDSTGLWPMGRTTISSGVHYLRILFRTVKRTTVHTMTIMPYTTPANTGRVSESGTGVDQAASSGSPQTVTERGFNLANLSGGALNISANESIYFTWTADAEL